MQLAVSCEQLVSYSCCNDTCCTTSLAIHGYDKLNNGSFPCRWCVIVFMVFKFLWVNTQYSVNAFDIWYVRLRIDRVVATICSTTVCVKSNMRSCIVMGMNCLAALLHWWKIVETMIARCVLPHCVCLPRLVIDIDTLHIKGWMSEFVWVRSTGDWIAHTTLLYFHDKGVQGWDTLLLVNIRCMVLFCAQASLPSFPFAHLTRGPQQ